MKICRINYKSDFLLTLHSDAGWAVPFCIKFWTSAPKQAYFAGWDGQTWTHCAYDPAEPTKLKVQFDDHRLTVGELRYEISYHFAMADFPDDTEDEVLNRSSVVAEVDGMACQVVLDFNGETAPGIQFALPAYANEAQRIANEETRIEAEQQRVSNEEARIAAEETRQQNEQQRISLEQQRINQEQQRFDAEAERVSEFAGLKAESEAATAAANSAATLANEKAQLATDKAALAQAAAVLANEKAQLATDKAALAQAAAALANEKAQLAADKAALAQAAAALANDKAALAQQKADYAKAQGDYAKEQGDTVLPDHERAEADHTTAAADHETAASDHIRAESDRTTAASDHTRADSDHATAIADHTTAASDHTRAESDHTTAAADHTQAGQDHTRAESDHSTAVTDHETYAEDVTETKARVTALEAVVADIETIAEGYVRVAGSSSPALSYKSYKYHEQGGFGRESVFSLFYPCLVGTKLSGDDAQVGTILHVLQKFGARTIDGVPMWLDIYGTPHKIDGSEGDVMIVNIEDFYSINGKHTIEGTEYDVFLMSRTPFTWQGIEAEHREKFGWNPDYCVSHTDTDNVVRMHSVYNPAWNGSYDAPVGVAGKYVYTTDPETGDIVETYDANETLLGGAGGLHSTDIDLPTGEQRAMNLNDDPTKTVPWMNQTAEGCNRLMSLILAEGGTFDAHNANLMGSGFSSNDPATAAGDWEQAGSGAKNGLRVVDKDGAWKYYALSGNVRFLTGATTGTVYAANVINSWRNPWHILEAHRAMSYAIENDVHELEWFVFEGNKYKYRSVQGFNGPSHGEMTCVVWKLMATQAGANAIDPTDGATSIAGNRVEILVSTALVHGMTTQVSPSRWTSGLLFTEDENGQYECYIERDQAELVKSLAAENYDPATPRDFETIYDHVLTVQKGDGYAKNYLNGALMLPDTNANKSGAGLHTYVGKYNWFTGGNASAGKRSVRGFRRGNYAGYTSLSPLAMYAVNSPSIAGTSIGFGTCCRIR